MARTLGIPNPEGLKAAELWMGAHPAAPCHVQEQGERTRLDLLIAAEPEVMLGSRVASEFGKKLPFLFKGLSAGSALSIQTHPDLARAREGFDRENAAGIPLDAPVRTYKDDNHKPEMTMALTPFTGLCGFRSPRVVAHLFSLLYTIDEIALFAPALSRMAEARSTGEAKAVAAGSRGGSGSAALPGMIAGESSKAGSKAEPGSGIVENPEETALEASILRELVTGLLGLVPETKSLILGTIRTRIQKARKETEAREYERSPDSQLSGACNQAHLPDSRSGDCPDLKETAFALDWVERLDSIYPLDPGILMPLVLNLILLQPGQAVFIGAGILHAYLEGTALEIMANSDNVIRGGLTPKHIDVTELVKVVRFESGMPERETALPVPGREFESAWPIHAREFRLSRLELKKGMQVSTGSNGPEILLCVQGEMKLAIKEENGGRQQSSLPGGGDDPVSAASPDPLCSPDSTRSGSAPELDFSRGMCLFLTPCGESGLMPILSGEGIVYRASVP